MAESRLNLIIQTKGEEKLRRLKGDADKVDKKFEELADSSRKAGDGIDKAGRAAGRNASKFRNAAGTIKQLVGAYVGLRTAQAALQAGLARGESERRLAALARGYGEVEEAAAVATRAAERFGLSQTQANNEVAKLFGRLRTTGSTLQEIEQVYVGFNTALKVNGTNAQEAAGAQLQLAQALGSGVLRGQEFNSIFEATPAVIKAIGDELKVPIGQVRDLANEGKITSQVVIRALGRIAKEGAPLVDDALNSNVQKIINVQNAFEDLQVALTEKVIPEMTDAIESFTDLLKEIAPIVSGISQAFAFLFRLVTSQAKAAKQALDDLFSGNIGALFQFNKNGFNDLFGIETGPRKVNYPVQQFRYPSEGGGGTAGPTEKELKAAAKLEESRQNQLKAAKDQLFVAERELLLSQQTDELNKLKVQYNTDVLQLKRDTADAIAESLSAEETLTLQLAEQAKLQALKVEFEREATDLVKEQAEAKANALRPLQDEIELLQGRLNGNEDEIRQRQEIGALMRSNADITLEEATNLVKQRDNLKDLVTEADKLNEIFAQVGAQIKSALVDSITAAIDGSKDLQAIWADTLKSIGRFLINAGLSSIGGPGGAFGAKGIPGFSQGGVASAGKPALVGENGPEIIRPLTTTAVIPNDAFGEARDAIRTNSPASDSVVDAFADAQASIGSSASVMQMKAQGAAQQSMMDGGSVSVDVKTVNVGGLDVVSTEQFAAGMEATAKKARAQVFNALKNKPAARAGVGV